MRRRSLVGISDIRTARKQALPALALSTAWLAGCTTYQPPQFNYDADIPTLPVLERRAAVDVTRPLHTPPAWTIARGGQGGASASTRVGNANLAARVEPRREGYYNAIQVYPWSDGALYQVYASPGQISTIALEAGESLSGAGPIAAGDTVRWIIGDTESGSGESRRVQIMVKPTRADISTNLVVTTDRRVYLIELHAQDEIYMPAVAWSYPSQAPRVTPPVTPVIPAPGDRNHRYRMTGDNPPWRPVSVFDDGRRVYVIFPRGIVQGEMPPIFVLGPDGEPQLVNSRVHRNILIVDRLFGAAELRLGSTDRQQVVGIIRTNNSASAEANQSRLDHSGRSS